LPRGGRRPGAGRPLGRTDTKPRASKRLKELGVMAETGTFEQTEFLITNKDKEFAGDALGLLRAVYRAEVLPIKLRIYAASQSVKFETQVGEDDQQLGADTRVHIYLPDNGRDPELLAELGMISIEEREAWQKERNEIIERWDNQLHQKIVAGKLSEGQALEVRSIWIRPDDPPWRPVAPPVPPPRALPWHPPGPIPPNMSAPASNGAGIESPIGDEIELLARVVLFSAPGSLYQINGNTYRANRLGEIEADADDVEALREAGCRVQR
jgi:hypothetical protein